MGMVVKQENGFLNVPGWGEYQNIEGMELIREQNRARQKKWYERQKSLQEPNVRTNVIITEHNATDKDTDKDKRDKEESIYRSVITYLNTKAGTNYRSTGSKTRTCINARLNEGFTVEDFQKVIDRKCAEWIGTDFEKYLCPETLFGAKFERYLNAGGHRNGEHSGNPSDDEPNTGTWF